MEPSPCTPCGQELSKDTEENMKAKATPNSMDLITTKQNELSSSFIDRFGDFTNDQKQINTTQQKRHTIPSLLEFFFSKF